MPPKFIPTTDQIRCAEAVFTAIAFEASIRPIVEGYESQILKKHQFHISREWVAQGCADQIILDRKDSFLLSKEDSDVYFAECFAARDAANLKVDRPQDCPLLVAEHMRITAEHALLKAISSIPSLSSFGVGLMTLEPQKKAIDLTLSLLAPFCESADVILQRYMKAA